MTIQISIGYDSKAGHDYSVLEHSIRRRCSVGVDVRRVPEHDTVLKRPWEITQTTPFSFTRFLTPYLWDFKGVSIFMDPDMLCLCDIKELIDLYDPQYAVQVVKHDYVPHLNTKYVGIQPKAQYAYNRKNWASLIIFNNEKCKEIYTKEIVESVSGIMLHQFSNVDDNLVGALPKQYNYIVGEDNQASTGKIIHFSNGMPYVPYFSTCEYATEWFNELDRSLLSKHRGIFVNSVDTREPILVE